MAAQFIPSGSATLAPLDFEDTDFDAARQALDEVPAGVGELDRFTPGYWERRRRTPQASDRLLTGVALAWNMALPPDARPQRLAEDFPRVANAIAAVWSDARLAAVTIDDLLTDRRGRRRGFPVAVQQELRALRALLPAVMANASERRAALPESDDGPATVPAGLEAVAAGDGASGLRPYDPDTLELARRVLVAAGYRVIPPGG